MLHCQVRYQICSRPLNEKLVTAQLLLETRKPLYIQLKGAKVPIAIQRFFPDRANAGSGPYAHLV